MWFDALILCILIYATIRGAMKGIVWQLAVIASLIFCFGFAGSGSLAVAPYIGLKPPLNRWVAMFVLYAVFSFVAFGVARLVRDWIEEVRFVEFDRHLGAVLGFVKGSIFCLFVTFFSVTLSEKFRGEVLDSHTGRIAAIVMDRLHPVMPDELHDVLEPYIHQLDQPGLDLKHAHGDSDHDGHDHDHDGHEHPDDPFETPPSPFAETQPGGDDVTSWISKLPQIVDSGLKAMVREAFENTTPEERSELFDRLKTSAPGGMRTIVDEWQEADPNRRQSSATPDRQLMLEEIADSYGLDYDTREMLLLEVRNSLAGVPAQVADATIRDWHADILGIRPDPDSGTNARSRLDLRIVRQLTAARIPVNNLDSALQTRLRDAERR